MSSIDNHSPYIIGKILNSLTKNELKEIIINILDKPAEARDIIISNYLHKSLKLKQEKIKYENELLQTNIKKFDITKFNIKALVDIDRKKFIEVCWLNTDAFTHKQIVAFAQRHSKSISRSGQHATFVYSEHLIKYIVATFKGVNIKTSKLTKQ